MMDMDVTSGRSVNVLLYIWFRRSNVKSQCNFSFTWGYNHCLRPPATATVWTSPRKVGQGCIIHSLIQTFDARCNFAQTWGSSCCLMTA